MAHIADYMVDPSFRPPLRNCPSRTPSPKSSQETASTRPGLTFLADNLKITEKPAVEEEEKEKFVWRMHQPTESRRYQLFPAPDKLTITSGLRRRSPDQEPQMVQQPPTVERQSPLVHSTLKREQHLSRWRKPSVSDLGPMTTVQEIAMDSPTIPGRPPLHERSISAPGHSVWRRNVFGDSMVSLISGPVVIDETFEVTSAPIHQRRRSDSPKSPRSPRNLAPIVIPPNLASATRGLVAKYSSDGRLRGEEDAPEVPPKSARMLNRDKNSPQTAQSIAPFTPVNTTSLPVTSANATPISSFSGRSSPFSALSSGQCGPSPIELLSSSSASGSTSDIYTKHSHKRNESEASIIDRGRPKKRNDGSPVKGTKQSAAAEQHAFETLPQGIRACEASATYHRQEIETLRNQAIGQAGKFEVLCSRDVDILSRELRGLDERCDYLRKTHQSLRSERRNLHQRICNSLRSPRVARFSHESLLKQEEALSAFDASIDDWFSKLEQAENRRIRVRQKLLEHVAAALTLDISKSKTGGTGEQTPPRSPTKAVGTTSSSDQRELGRDSPSPHRLARIIPPAAMMAPPPVYGGPSASPHRVPNAAPVITTTSPSTTAQSFVFPPTLVMPSALLPATVFQTPIPATASPISTLLNPNPPSSSAPVSTSTSTTTSTSTAVSTSSTTSTSTATSTLHPPQPTLTRRPSTSSIHSYAESIRIYADSDVYALLADVEDEIMRLGQFEEEETLRPKAEPKQDPVQAGEMLGSAVFGGVVNAEDGGLSIPT